MTAKSQSITAADLRADYMVVMQNMPKDEPPEHRWLWEIAAWYAVTVGVNRRAGQAPPPAPAGITDVMRTLATCESVGTSLGASFPMTAPAIGIPDPPPPPPDAAP